MIPSSIKIPVPWEYVAPHGALCLGVEPATDFDKRGQDDDQMRDKETGERVWLVKVLDLDPEAGKFGASKELKVKVVAATPARATDIDGAGLPAAGGVHRRDAHAVCGLAEVQGQRLEVPSAAGVVDPRVRDGAAAAGGETEGGLSCQRASGGGIPPARDFPAPGAQPQPFNRKGAEMPTVNDAARVTTSRPRGVAHLRRLRPAHRATGRRRQVPRLRAAHQHRRVACAGGLGSRSSVRQDDGPDPGVG